MEHYIVGLFQGVSKAEAIGSCGISGLNNAAESDGCAAGNYIGHQPMTVISLIESRKFLACMGCGSELCAVPELPDICFTSYSLV